MLMALVAGEKGELTASPPMASLAVTVGMVRSHAMCQNFSKASTRWVYSTHSPHP